MATPEEMAASMRANLKEKTGKTMAQWLKLTKAAELEKHGQIVKLLKSEHGVGHGYANLIAHETLGGLEHTPDPFGGKKAALKPIHDAILKVVKRFGKDVEVSPNDVLRSGEGAEAGAGRCPGAEQSGDLPVGPGPPP